MEHSALQLTAASWHDRLHRSKVTDETRAAFAAWLAESPEHGAAYAQVDDTWSGLVNAAHDPEILALRHETALRLTRSASSSSRVYKWRAAAIVLLGLAVLTALSTSYVSDRVPIASLLESLRGHGDGRYVTATGERLTVTLNDGSQLTLNTQTELRVAFHRNERTVHLVRGQALFEVAKDPTRPFVVETRQRRFVAVGTAFDVRLEGDRVDVTMIEGVVRVERSAAVPAATIVAGEQLTVDKATEDHVRPADPERVTSWRRGQVIFENTRLADAIAELNRYSEKKIELADPALAELRLSGGFSTGRPALFVEAVTTYFPIQIERADDRLVLLRARH